MEVLAKPIWNAILWLIQISEKENWTVPPLFLNVYFFVGFCFVLFLFHSLWITTTCVVFQVAVQKIRYWKDPPVGFKPELWQGQNFFVGCFCAVILLSILLNVCMGILVSSQIFIYHDSHVPGWSFLSERRLSCLSSPFISPLSYYCILEKMGKQTSSNPENN